MDSIERQNLEIVERFLKTLETGGTGDTLSTFYDPDVVQIEYPNTLTKNGATRNLDDLKIASERGKQVLTKQTYEIVRSYVSGDTVIIEAIWRGILAIPVGSVPAGGEMKAYFAQFFEIKGGKIVRQRNYDCFEPFV